MSYVNLKSHDGDLFKVDIEVAQMLGIIKTMLELHINDTDDEPIPLKEVSSPILKKVIEWATYHKGEIDYPVEPFTEIPEWDKNFFEVDQTTLLLLIKAASFLDVPSLLQTGCKIVATMIMGKTVEEMREIFNIKNDFTEAEEDEIRKENEWCEWDWDKVQKKH